MSAPTSPVIVPLDFSSAQRALAMAARLDPRRCRVKVGKELFVSSGPEVIRRLHDAGFEVFLDLKFHDIPNTVEGACRAAARLGVWMMNVHAGGGRAMMEAARRGVGDAPGRPLLIAVTVLTSLSRAALAETGVEASPEAQAARLALLAESAGVDGVVCSAHDLAAMRGAVNDDFLRVTPGIRPAGASADDQHRVATPAGAMREGATHLVIGRPITGAAEPAAALAAIQAEIDAPL